MKRALLVVVYLVLIPSLVGAQGGTIGLFRDPSGMDCTITDTAGLVAVQVVHVGTAGANASQFSAPVPPCWTGAVFLSDTAVFPVTLGGSQIGVAVAYGACQGGPIHILTINVFAQGLSSVCCKYPSRPDPGLSSAQIEVVDCSQNLLFGKGQSAVVNSDGTCTCGPGATEDSTWGKMKSLYGE